MNSIAGPSRRRAPLHIDLDRIIVDQPRHASPLYVSSPAPSWRPERASTQSGISTETWGEPQTPRTERSDRSSFPSIHCGISIGRSDSSDDTVSYGGLHLQVEEGDTRGMGVMENGKTAGWWTDLDKTPRPSTTMTEPQFYPSRYSSLPSRPSLSVTIPYESPPRPNRDDAALPDDSPTIPPSVLLPPAPSFALEIPTFRSHARPRIPTRPHRPDTVVTQEFLALFPVPELQSEPSTSAVVHQVENPTGPPPPIPPRRSSRRKSSQPDTATTPVTLPPLSTSFVASVTGPPPPPPPRASSLRSASSRASRASSSSSISAASPLTIAEVLAVDSDRPVIRPTSASPVSLSRQPRVRSRTAPVPIITRSRVSSGYLPTVDSRTSLASIVEDERNDLEEEPSGEWSLRERRRQSELHRARSQPHVRRARDDFTLARQMSVRQLCMV